MCTFFVCVCVLMFITCKCGCECVWHAASCFHTFVRKIKSCQIQNDCYLVGEIKKARDNTKQTNKPKYSQFSKQLSHIWPQNNKENEYYLSCYSCAQTLTYSQAL